MKLIVVPDVSNDRVSLPLTVFDCVILEGEGTESC